MSPQQFWPLWWCVSLPIRVQTMLNHIFICFLPQYQCQRKCFFQSMSWKRRCVTHRREQPCLDSYRQWQIIQSDGEISSNCGKNYVILLFQACLTLSFPEEGYSTKFVPPRTVFASLHKKSVSVVNLWIFLILVLCYRKIRNVFTLRHQKMTDMWLLRIIESLKSFSLLSDR